jgi:hypothetical protein
VWRGKQLRQKVAALQVLQYVGGVYQVVQLFNFVAAATIGAAAQTLSQFAYTEGPNFLDGDFDVSDSNDFGAPENLDESIRAQTSPGRVYTGDIKNLGDFVVSEDGSMIFRGDSSKRVESIAFDTEKTLVLDSLNTERAILSASKAVLRNNADKRTRRLRRRILLCNLVKIIGNYTHSPNDYGFLEQSNAYDSSFSGPQSLGAPV